MFSVPERILFSFVPEASTRYKLSIGRGWRRFTHNNYGSRFPLPVDSEVLFYRNGDLYIDVLPRRSIVHTNVNDDAFALAWRPQQRKSKRKQIAETFYNMCEMLHRYVNPIFEGEGSEQSLNTIFPWELLRKYYPFDEMDENYRLMDSNSHVRPFLSFGGVHEGEVAEGLMCVTDLLYALFEAIIRECDARDDHDRLYGYCVGEDYPVK